MSIDRVDQYNETTVFRKVNTKLEKVNEKEKRKFNQMFAKATNKAMTKYCVSAKNDVKREHCFQPF